MERHLVGECDGDAAGAGSGARRPRADDHHTRRGAATTMCSPRQSTARQQPSMSAYYKTQTYL